MDFVSKARLLALTATFLTPPKGGATTPLTLARNLAAPAVAGGPIVPVLRTAVGAEANEARTRGTAGTEVVVDPFAVVLVAPRTVAVPEDEAAEIDRGGSRDELASRAGRRVVVADAEVVAVDLIRVVVGAGPVVAGTRVETEARGATRGRAGFVEVDEASGLRRAGTDPTADVVAAAGTAAFLIGVADLARTGVGDLSGVPFETDLPRVVTDARRLAAVPDHFTCQPRNP